MKKIIAILAVILLPLLASAYELEPQYKQMTQELNVVIDNQISASTEETETADLYSTVVSILKRAVGSSGAYGGFGTGGAGGSSSETAYKVDVIKSGIREQLKQHNIDIVQELRNDEAARYKVAKYVTKESPLQNNFEALWTLGMEPVEAAVWTNKEEYIESAVNNHEITYTHYEPYTDSGWGYSRFGFTTEAKTITDIQVTEEEVQEFKDKKQYYLYSEQTAQSSSSSRSSGGLWDSFARSFNGMGRGYGHW